jgi:hypothetical protein
LHQALAPARARAQRARPALWPAQGPAQAPGQPARPHGLRLAPAQWPPTWLQQCAAVRRHTQPRVRRCHNLLGPIYNMQQVLRRRGAGQTRVSHQQRTGKASAAPHALERVAGRPAWAGRQAQAFQCGHGSV